MLKASFLEEDHGAAVHSGGGQGQVQGGEEAHSHEDIFGGRESDLLVIHGNFFIDIIIHVTHYFRTFSLNNNGQRLHHQGE